MEQKKKASVLSFHIKDISSDIPLPKDAAIPFENEICTEERLLDTHFSYTSTHAFPVLLCHVVKPN